MCDPDEARQEDETEEELLHSPEEAAQIREAVARLARRFRTLQLPNRLTHERLSTLAAIKAEEPIRLSDLAAKEMVGLGTMSRMIASLESMGLVRRKEHKHDGRAMLVSTTAKGRRAYDRALQWSLEEIIAIVSSLEPGQLAALRRLLSSVQSVQGRPT